MVCALLGLGTGVGEGTLFGAGVGCIGVGGAVALAFVGGIVVPVEIAVAFDAAGIGRIDSVHTGLYVFDVEWLVGVVRHSEVFVPCSFQ